MTLEKIYDPRQVEPDVYAAWESAGAFIARPDGRPREKTFCIVIPPPNVTGALHLGHALNNTLQDVLVRWHRMRGFNTLWQPGTDHAGIATQAVVEKRIREQEGLTRHQLGATPQEAREELVRRIWTWKDEYEKRILSQLKLMGCSCDWSRTRFTFDEGLSRAVRHIFFKLFKDGLIFRGKRLVNWDTQLQTAVSDDEVYHETVKGHFYHIRYPVLSEPRDSSRADPRSQLTSTHAGESAGTEVRGSTPEYVIIATTRPETMLGDVAVAVHPDPEGVIARAEAEVRAQLAGETRASVRAEWQARLDALAERRASHLPLLLTLRDMAKAGRKLLLPLVNREIPLICDEWADPMLGTGCVKITPAHDPNDYQVGVRHNLPMINVLKPDGRIARIEEPGSYRHHAPDGSIRSAGVNPHSANYEGLEFSTAGRKKVVADLEARGLLEKIEDRDIDLAHSDRSKTAIEPFLSDQWFVRTGDPEPRGFSPRESTSGENIQDGQNHSQDAAHTQTRAFARAEARGSVGVSEARRWQTPNAADGATLLTWTTYGTWLPGDERGSVSRAERVTGRQELRNLPGEPYDDEDQQRRSTALERMEGEAVWLTPEQARRVMECIAETCDRHAIQPLAVAVMANHVHILCQAAQHGQELLQLFKGYASFQLGKAFVLGNSPRWWTKSGSRRRIRAGSDLTAALEYVKSQEHPLCLWSFDTDAPDAIDLFERAPDRAAPRGFSPRESTSGEPRGFSPRESTSGENFAKSQDSLQDAAHTQTRTFARAEARGSGLAQAAMDEVIEGRIQVFPSRYAKSYLDWLGEKRDWCISRQLWWGHRIPIWSTQMRLSELLRDASYEPNRTVNEELSYVFEVSYGDVIIIQEIEGQNEWRLTSGVGLEGWEALDEALRFGDRAIRIILCPSVDIPPSEVQKQEYVRSSHALGFSDACPDDLDRMPGSDRTIRHAEDAGLTQDSDVLDTWFSSALWPFSTLGWPEETEDLKQYYPTTVLCTSRDIITNWVARMVMFGLYAMGRKPFDHVYIHPKILDGRGETMSKSKGNGVDPVDIIHTHGADALRYTMADMTTETQDIRMPVNYVCAHCGKLTDQALAIKNEEQNRKSRGVKLERGLQPSDVHRVKCSHKECGKEFATQWADADVKQQLGLGRETSEKFDIGRNFCNKLWNAARFAFMNLEGTPYRRIEPSDLLPEDRWILARLSQTCRRVHELLSQYQFSATVKELRDFFWDSLCDWYIELTKGRMSEPRGFSPRESTSGDNIEDGQDLSQDAAHPHPRGIARAEARGSGEVGAIARAEARGSGEVAQQVLAFCLDQTLRLFHPIIPFITERLWRQLNEIVPRRGLPGLAELPDPGGAEHAGEALLATAAFPPAEGHPALEQVAGGAQILEVFAQLQNVVRAVRDLRAACKVSPKDRVSAVVVLPPGQVESFRAQVHIVQRMAGVGEVTVVPEGSAQASRPKNAGSLRAGSLRVYVPGITDDAAERARATKELADVEKQITGKESRLRNEKFVANADPELVESERRRLAELAAHREALKEHLAELG